MFGWTRIKNRLLWRVLAQVVVVFAVLTVGATAIFYWGVRAWNQRAYGKANRAVLRSLLPAWQEHHGAVISTIIRVYSFYLPTRVGEGTPLAQAEREAQERLAGLIQLGYTGVERLFVLKKDGALDYELVYSNRLHTVVTKRVVADSLGKAWIRLALKSPVASGRIVTYTIAGGDCKYLMHFASTWKQRVGYRQFAAVLSLRETMKDVAERAGLRSLQGLVILTGDGTVLYEKDPRWVGQHISRFFRRAHLPPAAGTPQQIRVKTHDGRTFVVNWARFNISSGDVVVGVYTDLSAFEPALLHRTMAAEVALSVFALLVVSVLVSWRLRKVLGTVANLSAEAEKIARGRWGGQVPVSTQDEVGKLAENFNKMSRTLAQLVDRVAKERNERQHQQEISEIRATLLQALGHDLNKLLTAIKNPIEGAVAKGYGNLPESTERPLRRALVAVRLMNDMVQNILASARIERGQVRLELSHFRERDLMTELRVFADALAERWKHKGVSIEFEDNAADVPLVADREKLVRVLVNLMTNAVESVRRREFGEGRVWLRSMVDGFDILFEVSDNGEGLDANTVERWFRGNEEERICLGTTGLGLGLTIVRMFVRLHGGEVNVESSRGTGTTFRVRIPRVAVPSPEGDSGDSINL